MASGAVTPGTVTNATTATANTGFTTTAVAPFAVAIMPIKCTHNVTAGRANLAVEAPSSLTTTFTNQTRATMGGLVFAVIPK